MIFLFHYLPSYDIVLVKNGIYIVLSLWVHLTLLITLRVCDNDNYDDGNHGDNMTATMSMFITSLNATTIYSGAQAMRLTFKHIFIGVLCPFAVPSSFDHIGYNGKNWSPLSLLIPFQTGTFHLSTKKRLAKTTAI